MTRAEKRCSRTWSSKYCRRLIQSGMLSAYEKLCIRVSVLTTGVYVAP